MTALPLSLFDGTGQVHTTDPFTSWEAAADEARLVGQRRQVYLALRQAGERGLTGHEACELTSCAYPHSATTRLEELERRGLAVRTDVTRLTPSRKRALVWRAAS